MQERVNSVNTDRMTKQKWVDPKLSRLEVSETLGGEYSQVQEGLPVSGGQFGEGFGGFS